MADYAKNKKAHFDYEMLQDYEAGIELKGYEVKAIKTGKADMNGAFVIIRGEEAYLTNTRIPPYQKANTPADYDETRTRRLLLHKKELRELVGKTQQSGLTLVAIRLYNKKGKVKLQFALARGKKKYDKREKIKKREADRKIGRSLKTHGDV